MHDRDDRHLAAHRANPEMTQTIFLCPIELFALHPNNHHNSILVIAQYGIHQEKPLHDAKEPKNRSALVTYVTAGFPTHGETVDILLGMEAGGAGKVLSLLKPIDNH